ncbi:MmcQ/YjbR family DNA-binding protein [Caulobacter rhizosphaerae]|jgi:hypothetical protein|uniref:MmcQ/YjbR family DNA-binding protein n=1 Tax=Caulobacter rhizosphaerae TaxID=2010972 RepID=UPI0013D0822E|nr:MmcQ/YjbR family DNA-binding protein [Caulobacter rhizosphaerae]GGL09702.1 hypothetical protein GCM10010983_03550 [Caulobacter rhizosphaerae]
MTPEAFIALGAGLAMVKTKTVMGAVRLAVHGKTFTTVGWPQAGWAVVKLSPNEQADFIALSNAITPEPGRRGRKGVTLVRLRAVSEAVATRLLIAAWQAAAAPTTSLAKAG